MTAEAAGSAQRPIRLESHRFPARFPAVRKAILKQNDPAEAGSTPNPDILAPIPKPILFTASAIPSAKASRTGSIRGGSMVSEKSLSAWHPLERYDLTRKLIIPYPPITRMMMLPKRRANPSGRNGSSFCPNIMESIVPIKVISPISKEGKRGICTLFSPYDRPTARLSKFDDTANSMTDNICKITPSLQEVRRIDFHPLSI